MNRQARLANARWTDERQETHIVAAQQRTDRRGSIDAIDQRGSRNRERVEFEQQVLGVRQRGRSIERRRNRWQPPAREIRKHTTRSLWHPERERETLGQLPRWA
jgi:hypothetical protein